MTASQRRAHFYTWLLLAPLLVAMLAVSLHGWRGSDEAGRSSPIADPADRVKQ